MRGFTLLPVVLAMGILAAIAFLLNRDNGLNARMITQQGDTERARYVAEAGLQAVNFVVQAAGCDGVFPTSAPPVNFAGGSYTAYSTSVGGSPVTLMATGRYNGAAVTLSRSVSVYQARQNTVLQPAAGQDTYVNTGFPNRNYGADTRLRLYTASYQPLLKFDLSAFPLGTRVIPWYDTSTSPPALKAGATLSLYQSQVGSTTATKINAQLITRSWIAGTMNGGSGSPNGATWNTYDGANPWPSAGVGYAPTPVAWADYKNTTGWVDWDVTNAVAGWMSTVYQNYGWWLVESGGSIGDTYYSSSENSTASQRPKLTLNYLQPCATSLGLALNAAAETYLNATDNTRNFGGATVLDVSYKTPGPERRILLRFDITAIPAGSNLKSGILRLYCGNVISATNNPKAINAWFVIAPWVEGTQTGTGTANGATWKTRDGTQNWASTNPNGSGGGGDYYTGGTPPWSPAVKEEATGLSPLPGAFRQGWVSFDIKDAVQYWSDNRATANTNNGIELIFSSSVSDIIEFDSRESPGGRAPQLVVTY